MTGHRDQDGGAGFSVPQEYTDLAERVTKHLSSYSFDPATRARHLHHLRELAAAQPLPRPVRGRGGLRWRGLPRRLAGTAAASLATFMLSGSAVAAAAQGAVAGDPLYGTKLFVERVELAAALTPQGDVAVRLDHADQRLGEAETLVDQGVTDERLVTTLAEHQQELEEANQRAGEDEGLQQQVTESATVASDRLEPIAQASLPEPARERADAALAAAQEVASTPPSASQPSVSPPVGPEPGKDPGPEVLFPQLPPDLEIPPLPSTPDGGQGNQGEPTNPMNPGDPERPVAPEEPVVPEEPERPGNPWKPDTEYPTEYPTDSPPEYPTEYPTDYPTSFSTPSYPALPTSYTSPPPEKAVPTVPSTSHPDPGDMLDPEHDDVPP